MTPPTITAETIPDAWIQMLRDIIKRDGIAVRAGDGATIQTKCLTTNRWGTLMLFSSVTQFASEQDRDAVLATIVS